MPLKVFTDTVDIADGKLRAVFTPLGETDPSKQKDVAMTELQIDRQIGMLKADDNPISEHQIEQYEQAKAAINSIAASVAPH